MSHHIRPRTRLNPEIRREQIVDAAERVFQGRDPAEVTFEEIAEAAGVSRGLVYNYFGDKQGLVAAVYVRGMQRLDDRLADAVEGTDDLGEERLRRIADAYLAFARDSAWGIASVVGSNSALTHPEAREARRRIERLAERWFDGASGPVLASGVVGLLEGVALGWLEDADHVELDDVARAVAALLWSGLAAVGAQTVQPA
ncbi:MAG: TetR/AcrR family transcriptional regulator [Actinomycetota bacterium]